VNISRHIAEARSGNGESLNRLMAHYRGYLRMLAGNSLDGLLRVKADPSDIAQEALYAACRDFHEFRGGTEREFAAWLRKILANTIAALARKYKLAAARDVGRERSIEADLEKSSFALGTILASKLPAPSQMASERERGVVLADALGRLPEEHRRVIVLRDLEQRSWAECGRRMDRSPDAVRMLWTRALAKLGPILREMLG